MPMCRAPYKSAKKWDGPSFKCLTTKAHIFTATQCPRSRQTITHTTKPSITSKFVPGWVLIPQVNFDPIQEIGAKVGVCALSRVGGLSRGAWVFFRGWMLFRGWVHFQGWALLQRWAHFHKTTVTVIRYVLWK